MSRFRFNSSLIVLLSSLGACGLSTTAGTDFTPGNIVVLRQGNGTTTTQFNATPVSLLEFTPTGSLVQTVTLTSTGGGAKLTQAYDLLMTEGWLSRSGDGQFLYLSGYNAAAGTSNVASSGATTTIARVGANALPDLSTSTTSFTTNSRTGAAGADGSRYWATSDTVNNTDPRIVTALTSTSGAATTVLAGSATAAGFAPRVIGGQLYYTDFNSALVRTNTALPTSASGSTVVVSYNSAAGTLFPGEYVFLDRNAGVAGFDTLYIAGQNGLQKFSFDGTSWTARGSVAGAFFGLEGSGNAGSATLFSTTGNGQVQNNQFGTFVDSAAFNANISASFTPFGTTAGANNFFLGVAFAPVTAAVPEPGTIALITGLGLAGAGLWVHQRRKQARNANLRFRAARSKLLG